MSAVSYVLEDKTAVVTLDDGKANALSEAAIDELLAALARAENEAGALVLAGRPERFSAGFDLKVMMASPASAKALLRRGVELFMRFYGSPIPIVAASTGHALAGGALLLLCCDVRVGAAGAYRIGLNEVAIGLPVPVLAIELARDRVGKLELARATLGATIYGPDEAARVGYLDEVVPADRVLARAKEHAAKLGALPRPAYAGTKDRLRGRTIAHIRSTFEQDMESLLPG